MSGIMAGRGAVHHGEGSLALHCFAEHKERAKDGPGSLRKCDAPVTIKEGFADVAQLVEQSIRNRQVTGSIPVVGSIFSIT